MVPYYREFTKEKALPLDGGNREAATQDLIFYSIAGQIKGDPASLNVTDFWDFGPIERANAKLGQPK